MSRGSYNLVVLAGAVTSLFLGAIIGRLMTMPDKVETPASRVAERSFVLGEEGSPVPMTILDPRFGVVCYVLGSSMSCVALNLAEQPRGDL